MAATDNDATEPDEQVAKLAYDAAIKRLERQEKKLDELRGRTTLVLGATGVATSFLAGTALADRGSDFSPLAGSDSLRQQT